MRTGPLRNKVQILRWVESGKDDRGKSVGNWIQVWDCWAKIVHQGGQERHQDQQNQATRQWTVTVRNRPVLVTDRVQWGELLLDIGSVGEDERTRETVLICEEA